MPASYALLLLKGSSDGIGLEWMPIAAFAIPAVLLLLLIWLGSRQGA